METDNLIGKAVVIKHQENINFTVVEQDQYLLTLLLVNSSGEDAKVNIQYLRVHPDAVKVV